MPEIVIAIKVIIILFFAYISYDSYHKYQRHTREAGDIRFNRNVSLALAKSALKKCVVWAVITLLVVATLFWQSGLEQSIVENSFNNW